MIFHKHSQKEKLRDLKWSRVREKKGSSSGKRISGSHFQRYVWTIWRWPSRKWVCVCVCECARIFDIKVAYQFYWPLCSFVYINKLQRARSNGIMMGTTLRSLRLYLNCHLNKYTYLIFTINATEKSDRLWFVRNLSKQCHFRCLRSRRQKNSIHSVFIKINFLSSKIESNFHSNRLLMRSHNCTYGDREKFQIFLCM